MMVADAKLTGTWEKALAQIEGRTLDPESLSLIHILHIMVDS